MRDALRSLLADRASVLDLARALMAAAGVGLLAYGAWLAWAPAGFLVPGALLFGLEQGWSLAKCAELGNRVGAIKIASKGPQNYTL